MPSNFFGYKKENLIYLWSNYSGIKVIIDIKAGKSIQSRISIKNSNIKGRAHALEHMIFCGSKNYPIPFSLFDLADHYYSCVAANTKPNVTEYELNSIDIHGFVNMLPIYLDAIFNPLLPESFYTTEIHHIDGYGNDGGTVYHEDRKKRFNTKIFSTDRSYIPDLNELKEHHRHYYRTDSCIIKIKGRIHPNYLLKVIEKFEKENVLKNLSIPLPNDVFPLTKFQDKINIVKTPIVSEYVEILLYWNTIDVALRELFSMNFLIKYYVDMIQKMLGSNGSCQSMYCICKPYVYGFYFGIILMSELDNDCPNKIISKVMKTIFNAEIDMDELKKLINEKNQKQDFFDEVVKYQLYSNDKNNEFNFYSSESEYSKLLDENQDHWTNLARKFFTEDYTVVVYYPDKMTISNQTKNELSRVKKRKEDWGIDGLDKLKKKLSKNIEINKKLISNKLNLNEFKNIERTFEDRKFPNIANENTVLTKIPVIYHRDRYVSLSSVRFELIFDICELPREYYKYLMLFKELKPKDASGLKDFNYSFERLDINVEFNGLQCIYCIETTLDETWKIGLLTDCLLTSVDDDRNRIIEVLRKLIIECRNHITLETFVDNLILHEEESIDRYSNCYLFMVKTHKEFLKMLDEENGCNSLVEALKSLDSSIRKCSSSLNIYVNHQARIPRVTLIKWPKLNYTKKIVTINSKMSNLSRHVNKKYSFLVPENRSTLLKRYLPITIELDSDEYHYLNLLNKFFLRYVLFRTRGVYGLFYTSKLFLNGTVSLVYKIEAASCLSQIEDLHRNLIRDNIVNRNIDPQEFELAKKNCVYYSPNRLATFNKLKNLDFDTVIDAVGQMYLDLFDDSKTSLAMLLPESLKEQSELYDGIEYRDIET